MQSERENLRLLASDRVSSVALPAGDYFVAFLVIMDMWSENVPSVPIFVP